LLLVESCPQLDHSNWGIVQIKWEATHPKGIGFPISIILDEFWVHPF